METYNEQSKKRKQSEELDEFSFRPITDGLGFHRPNSSEFNKIQKLTEKVEISIQRESHPYTSSVTHAPRAMETSSSINDLSMFYGQSMPTTTTDFKNTAPVLKREDFHTPATKSMRAVAFSLDVIILALVTFLSLRVIDFISDTRIIEGVLALDVDMASILGIFFTFYYLGYFTILEKFQGATLGKDAINIYVSKNKGPVDLTTAFFRSFLTYFSFISLGLLAFVDLQGRATNTQVLKK